MSELQTIETEVVEAMGQQLEVREAPVTLFRTEDPAEIVAKATAIATTLSDVLKKQNLTTQIGRGEHVRVEGWSLLGTMLGVFPVCVWTRKVEGDPHNSGWEARVEARTRDGAIVGAAEAECLRSEKEWGPNPSKGKPRDDYALRSMAQTRATSKALRQPLGFVVSLAGFDPTPAEEMPRDDATGRGGGGQYGHTEPGQPARAAGSWAGVKQLIEGYPETWDAWVIFGKQARDYLYPNLVDEKLSKEANADMLKLTIEAANALAATVDPARFPPPNRDELVAAWKTAVGVELEGPAWRMGPDETEREVKDAS